VDLPASVTGPIAGMVFDMPLILIGGMSGKQSADNLLDFLPQLLDATGQQLAESGTYEAGGLVYPVYRITVRVRNDVAAPPTPVTPPTAPGEPEASNWIETGGGWQYDLTWEASASDGGSPIVSYKVNQGGKWTTVNGATLTLAAQFSMAFPLPAYVEAHNEYGASDPSSTASLIPPP
jgi:hypothetical protein